MDSAAVVSVITPCVIGVLEGGGKAKSQQLSHRIKVRPQHVTALQDLLPTAFWASSPPPTPFHASVQDVPNLCQE